MSNADESRKVAIKIDLSDAKKIAETGIRRAAAFLKVSQDLEWTSVPEQLTLNGGIAYGFFPTAIDEDARKHIHAEYQAWVLSACLKEIDQHFSLFLDGIWNKLELSELHGKTVHSSELVPFDHKYVSDTNSARKLEKLAARIGSDIDSKHVKSISKARNLLTHGIGQVRKRDLNVDGALLIMWVAPNMIADDGDREIVVNDHPLDTHELRFPQGAKLSIEFVERNKTIIAGELLRFSERELAEICFYYQFLIGKIISDTAKDLSKKFGKEG